MTTRSGLPQQSLEALKLQSEREKAEHAPTERVGELQKVNAELQDSRAAALNIAEDAIEARQQAEEANLALRESEARLELAVHIGGLGHWELDLSTFELASSALCRRNFGRSPDDSFTYEDLGQSIHADDRERQAQVVRAAIENRSSFEIQYRVFTPAGELRHIEVRGRFESSSGADRLVGVSMDITERKRAEEELRESQETLKFTLETVKGGDWELDLLTGKAKCSFRHDQCFGATEPIPDWSYEKFLTYVHADDRANEDRKFREAVASGKNWNIHCRVIWPDGSLHWIESSGMNYRYVDGKPTRMLGMVRDITERKQTEQALAELTAQAEQIRRLYETVLSSTPDLAYVFDRNHRFTYANDSLLKMWGRTWDEANGKNCLELGYEPWHAAMHDREIEQVIATKKPIRGEVPFTGTHGRRIYDYIFVPVLGQNGEVEAVAGTTRDVTERKQAEERYQLATRATHDVVWDWNIPADQVVWSEALQSVFGYPPEQAGAVIDDAFSWWTAHIHPEDRARVGESFQRIADAGRTEWIEEYRFQRSNGTYADIYDAAFIVYDEQRRPIRVVGAMTDISERKQAEQSVRESEQRYRSLVSVLTDVPWTTNADGEFATPQSAWESYTGQRWEEHRGFGWAHAIHPEDREMVKARWFAARDSRTLYKSEGRLWHAPSKEYRYFVARATPLFDPDGSVREWVGTCTDVHERRKTEGALIRSEKLAATGRLAATMAHEVNNPLESVTNLLYLARKDTGMSAQARERLLLADQELDRVAHITKQTLGFYRDSAAPTSLDVSHSINDLLEMYSYRFGNREIQLEKELDISAKIITSAGELRQVFSNLFINAVDATPAGGRIRVRVRPAREWNGSRRRGVRITVADTGCGIDPSHKAKIFDAFHTTKQEIGTGLGLWLSRNLVEKHGGRIQVHSRVQPEQSGTVFSVFWPDGAHAEPLTLNETA